MKNKTKTILLSAALLTVVATGAGAATKGFAASASDHGRIGINKVKELAATAVNGQAVRAELEKERGVVYYDVDVLKNNREYDVHIDAQTGKTLKVERDDPDDDRSDNRRTAVGEKSSASPSPSVSPSPSSSADKPAISAEQASRIAADRVNGTVVKTELDTDDDDGVLHYEIELKTDRGEAEINVHAHTGKILSVDYDDDDDDLYDD
ncbi:PepSY domain-containing protein [Cohnella cellulosilytica]|uniref:PepSY domain-containing protein n=1 Tax=Cohnella cellulosilytica TaxID=986710 RepID=A0ABW2FKG8_9BACL